MYETVSPYALTDLKVIREELGNIPEQVQADVLIRILNSATYAIEELADRSLKSRTYENLRFTVREGYKAVQLEWPITQVTLLTISGATQDVWTPDLVAADPKDYGVLLRDIDRATLWSRVGWSPDMLGNLITMHAGYGDADGPAGAPLAPIPNDLIQATIITCREWYRLPTLQRQGITSESMQGQSINYRDATIPREAQELVMRYRRVYIDAA